jgi:hypothetical protein
MSNRYKGAVISATPPTTTGGEEGTASGAWTLEQQMQLQAAGLWPAQPTGPYIEEVFSTYLWAGNSGAQTITNNINLSGKGGLVWVKNRTSVANNTLQDTVRGVDKNLYSNTTDAQTSGGQLTSFTTTGFTISGSGTEYNASGSNYVSWTFREQPKFFDIVTWSGNSVSGRLIPQNLGSAPGCIIVKCTDLAGTNWAVWHRSLATGYTLQLQGTNAAFNTKPQWFNNSTQGSSTTFEVGNDTDTNETGYNYVAYLFAHNAGGFGLTGTDNVISCGSFNYNTDPQTVTLGYEPQWIMAKRSDGEGDWIMFDNMRGFTANSGGGIGKRLLANTSGAETNNDGLYYASATGFGLNLPSYGNYIYIAIRRGPMKVPTSGTSVFAPLALNNATDTTNTTGFPIDMQIAGYTSLGGYNKWLNDRLRGVNSVGVSSGGPYLVPNDTAAENSTSNNTRGWSNTGFNTVPNFGNTATAYWNFRRAPSFMDVVCYTGTGSLRTVTHNLAAVPELIIVKRRSTVDSWFIYNSTIGASKTLFLNGTNASTTDNTAWNSTSPTSTVFTVNTEAAVNGSGSTYVAYLFATCPGVSKVGTYTGTATTLQIDCGFTAGSRFVLIKRTDSTGDWYVWDSARGIVAGNDPYLLLNSTAAEVTNTDYVDTYNAGFEISSTAPAGINASGGTYIFLAIA